MKLACIGGGPAGLYLGILVKRMAPQHEVVIYERNRPSDTFGFGVVFSDATLGNLAAADPETHAQITERFARWDDIEIHAGGEVLRSTGHGFCGIERRALLQILQTRARELGVRVEFEHEIRSLDAAELADADVVVACDGVASWVREALSTELEPHVDHRSNKFVWLGCTVPYRAFTFLFKDTPHGLFRVHAYRYRESDDGELTSTFIAECREETWRALGLDRATEDETLATLEQIFEEELGGHRLVKNRSIWRNFPTVRCGRWHAQRLGKHVVLLGDAAHTAHFSIGSGTKLAMEDAIALRDELLAQPDLGSALAKYEARRRPEVEALQAAAQASLEWFEGTERYMAMAPVQLTYSLMTRSLRVSHASVAKRDPHLAHGVEQLLAAMVGITVEPPPSPTALPIAFGDRRARSRIALAPPVTGDTHEDRLVALGGAASEGAGLVITPALPASALASDDAAVEWRRIVEYVHGKGTLIAVRLIASTRATSDAIALHLALERAAFAGFDVLLLDCDDPEMLEQLPATIAAARGRWRKDGPIGAVVHDRPRSRAVCIGHAAQLVRAGADLLWITSAGDAGMRLPAAPLADRVRNELDVTTCLDGDAALLPDLDAAIAAGRADLVVVPRMPAGVRR